MPALRREAESALAILATELETQTVARVESAMRAEREAAEARRVKREEDHAAHVDRVRSAHAAAHAADVAALDAQAAERLDAAVRTAQMEATALLVGTMQHHEVVLEGVRAEGASGLGSRREPARRAESTSCKCGVRGS